MATTTVKKLDTFNAYMAEAVKLRAEIAAIKNTKLAPKQERLDELEEKILATLVQSGTDMHKTKLGAYSLRRSTVPKVVDWPAVDAWVIKHKATELYQRRLTTSAWNERIAAGQTIPGVEAVDTVSLVWRSA